MVDRGKIKEPLMQVVGRSYAVKIMVWMHLNDPACCDRAATDDVLSPPRALLVRDSFSPTSGDKTVSGCSYRKGDSIAPSSHCPTDRGTCVSCPPAMRRMRPSLDVTPTHDPFLHGNAATRMSFSVAWRYGTRFPHEVCRCPSGASRRSCSNGRRRIA